MAQVRLEVVATMPLPIQNGSLFMAVDFNNWQPGDDNFKLKKQSDSLYYIDLPRNTPAYFEYKITQGNWRIVESRANGRSRSNHVYDQATEANPNRVRVVIEGWENKPSYNFILNQIPENTPKDATIYIVGNFNNWKPNDERYKLQKQSDGTYIKSLVGIFVHSVSVGLFCNSATRNF
jgi:hypothetical protein